MPDPLQITLAAPESLTEVLSLVFGNREPQDALNRVRAALAEYREGRIAGGGLLAARRAKRLVGATFAQVLPGRTAIFFPPQLTPGEPEETAQRLVSSAVSHLRTAGVGLIHAILEGQPDPCDLARLESAGFTRLAELYYLLAEARDFPPAPPDGPLGLELYTTEKHPRLCAVVEATYEATLDCPELNGIRSAADILEGYGASLGPCPPHWFLLRHGGRDVGCLLLADYGEHGDCELTYMGLVPSARGNGWGLIATRHAQWIAQTMGRERLVLAVDSANQPARNMYGAAGFRGWDRRQVYMLVLHPQSKDRGPKFPSPREGLA